MSNEPGRSEGEMAAPPAAGPSAGPGPRPTNFLALRAVAVLVVVLLVFAFPWKADGSASYAADVPALDTIYPEGSPSVSFDPAHGSIDLANATPGPVRVDLLRSDTSFHLNASLSVTTQLGPSAPVWRNVSVTSPVPSNGRYFDLYLGSWNDTTVDFASVRVANALDPSQVLYGTDFHALPPGWFLSPYAHTGVFGDPALPAIETSTLYKHVGAATMLEPVPIPSGVGSITVSGLVRFNGTPGPLHIVVDVLDAQEHHLSYVADWPAWAPFAVPPLPLDLRFWTIELPLSVDLVLQPTNSSTGSLDVEVVNDTQIWYSDTLGAYRTGRILPVEIDWTIGQSMTLSVGLPSGRVTWSTSSVPQFPGIQALVQFEQATVSALVMSPPGYTSEATVANASLTYSGSSTYIALGSSDLPAIAGSAGLLAALGLMAPEWLPTVRRWARRVASLRFLDWFRWVGQRLGAHRLALLAGAATLALYGYLALTFGGHPYDSWVFKVWVYAGQTGGYRGVYIHPGFVGDAIVRGSTVPWSTTNFSYGPLSAALFVVIGRIVPPLSGYPSVVALNAANTISAEIKWLLALFTVAAGLVLYHTVRRTSGRANLGVAAFLLLVLNPAIAFDSVVWGETDSVLYLLFVLFAVAAAYRPTLAMAIVALAIAFKETGPILLFPAALLVLAPGLGLAERLRRVAVGALTLLAATIPLLWSNLLPSVLLSSYSGLFSNFVTGSTYVHPFVTPETYTVWTLFTGFVGGRGITRLATSSATPLVAGLTFSLLGTAAFGLTILVGLWLTRRCGASRSPLFWLLATSFGAVAFTALLTGTGARYYTLAIPGLAGAVALSWNERTRVRRWMTVSAYALPTFISFWTMMGLFTVIMRREYPDIRGLGLSYNPVSQFVARWYTDNGVITLGSIGAIALVLLASYLFLRVASPGPAAGGVGDPPSVMPRSDRTRPEEARPRAPPASENAVPMREGVRAA